MVLGQLHLIDMADLSHNGVANTKRSHGQVKLEPKTKEQKARTKEQIARQSLVWEKVGQKDVDWVEAQPLPHSCRRGLSLVEKAEERAAEERGNETRWIPQVECCDVMAVGPRSISSRIAHSEPLHT